MIKITKGDDRNINLYFVLQGSGRPFDLTGWTHISVFFKKQFGDLLEKSTDAYSTAAYALYQGVTFTAQALGTIGNSIVLAFDGTSTIAQVIDVWNTANPSNKVSDDADDESVILPALTFNLQHGLQGIIDVSVISDVLGHVKVKLNDYDTVQFLAGRSLSFKAVIDKGAPIEGERRKIIFENALEVVEDNI